ncbi:hypothetical protein ACFVKB_03965 [Rhodococcus sp. NPDC127530]|uniref:hypothetical protein n=1 Tax=unclassified Rhodococcus (in: high G+C Gram-positive bacteria) TaxID=192944 RepID=UPI00364375DA
MVVVPGAFLCEQLHGYIRAADLTVPEELLNLIDEIVSPGTRVSPQDEAWHHPDLASTSRRRRL